MSRFVSTLLGAALVLAACGGNDDTGDVATTEATTGSSVPATTPTQTIGPSGGSVASADGRLQVDIPEGALTEETAIEVSSITPADGGLEDTPIGGVYRLDPAGLSFELPVIVTHTLDAAGIGLEPGEVPFLAVLHGAEESWDLLDTAVRRDGQSVLVVAETTHFSVDTVIEVQRIGPFGDELQLALKPDVFTAEVDTGETVTLSADVPNAVQGDVFGASISWLLPAMLTGEPGDTGGFLECGSEGTGDYVATLDLVPREDASLVGIKGLGVFLGVVHTDLGWQRSISVRGTATCTKPVGGDAGDHDSDSVSSAGAVVTAGSLSGVLLSESVLDDVTFENEFLLSFLPTDDADVVLPELGKEIIAQIDEFLAGEPGVEILEPSVIFSQIQPSGRSQDNYGRAAILGDLRLRIFTAGGADFTEMWSFDLKPCPGFPVDCNGVQASGVTAGFVVAIEEFDLARGYGLIAPFFDVGTPPEDAAWAFRISGDMAHFTGDEIPGGSIGDPSSPPVIVDLKSGSMNGQQAVKLTFATPEPFAGAEYLKTASVYVRDDEGGFYFGSFGMVAGDFISNGFCGLGDCPADGSWPGFDVVLDDAGGAIVSWDSLPGNLTVAADTIVDDDPDPDSPVSTFAFENGAQIPFGDQDLDC